MRDNYPKPTEKSKRKPKLRQYSWILLILLISLISIVIYGYFDAKYPTSYLPQINSGNLKRFTPGEGKINFTNDWYILEVDASGAISVKSTGGETIMSGLTYYSDYKESGESYGLKNVTVGLNNDSIIVIQGSGANGVLTNILLKVSRSNPRIDVSIFTEYKYNTTVQREALILKYNVPVSEVYLKNRKVDLKPFEREYWLQKQGVRFGSERESSLIYNTPEISSIQLNTNKKLAIINLEYYLDHPLIYIPFQADGGRKWVDHSAAFYIPGSTRTDSFSFYFGYLPKVTPRLMLVPKGYLAGYVFTEHADGGNIRTHRASYFGSENISDPAKATGGFVGHEIPVTKSVFYDDFDGGLSVSPVNDLEEQQYLQFLDDLYATGFYDLCLHTPENTNSNRAYLAEAIKFMKERYDAKTWIDHGMFLGNNNRETFVCDGLDTCSEFYTADLWGKYDTRYFWSSAVEEIRFSKPDVSLNRELRNFRLQNLSAELWRRYWFIRANQAGKLSDAFAAILKGNFLPFELNSLQPFKGNFYPTPLYWQNITSTKQFYSWTTEFVYFGIPVEKAENQVKNEERQLDLLKENWGVFFNHGYYVRNPGSNNILCKKNGELVINPYFDQVLSYMDQMRDMGDLYLTTVRDLLDYWVMAENISFEYKPDGVINILNENEQPVKGLSLALKTDAKAVRINCEIPSCRQVGEDAIIWFDIPAKGKVSLQINDTDDLKR